MPPSSRCCDAGRLPEGVAARMFRASSRPRSGRAPRSGRPPLPLRPFHAAMTSRPALVLALLLALARPLAAQDTLPLTVCTRFDGAPVSGITVTAAYPGAAAQAAADTGDDGCTALALPVVTGLEAEDDVAEAPLALRLYPNPSAAGTLTALVTGRDAGDLTLSLYDAAGRRLAARTPSRTSEAPIPLAAGLYFVRADLARNGRRHGRAATAAFVHLGGPLSLRLVHAGPSDGTPETLPPGRTAAKTAGYAVSLSLHDPLGAYEDASADTTFFTGDTLSFDLVRQSTLVSLSLRDVFATSYESLATDPLLYGGSVNVKLVNASSGDVPIDTVVVGGELSFSVPADSYFLSLDGGSSLIDSLYTVMRGLGASREHVVTESPFEFVPFVISSSDDSSPLELNAYVFEKGQLFTPNNGSNDYDAIHFWFGVEDENIYKPDSEKFRMARYENDFEIRFGAKFPDVGLGESDPPTPTDSSDIMNDFVPFAKYLYGSRVVNPVNVSAKYDTVFVFPFPDNTLYVLRDSNSGSTFGTFRLVDPSSHTIKSAALIYRNFFGGGVSDDSCVSKGVTYFGSRQAVGDWLGIPIPGDSDQNVLFELLDGGCGRLSPLGENLAKVWSLIPSGTYLPHPSSAGKSSSAGSRGGARGGDPPHGRRGTTSEASEAGPFGRRPTRTIR